MTKVIQNNNKGISLKKVKQHSKDQISISQSVFHDTIVLYREKWVLSLNKSQNAGYCPSLRGSQCTITYKRLCEQSAGK